MLRVPKIALRKLQLGFMRLIPSIGFSGAPTINITIGASTDDFNLFTAAGSPSGRVNVVLTIAPGIELGSTSTATAGLVLGSGWNSGSKIQIVNGGTIMGKGGKGGQGEGASGCTPIAPVAAGVGGPAVDATGLPSTGMLDFYNNGTIAGAGGGGGYGGAGCSPGTFSFGGGGGGSGRGRTTTTGGAGGAANGSPLNIPGVAGGSGTPSVAGIGGVGGNHPNTNDSGGNGGDFAAAGTNGLSNGAPYGSGAAAGAATLGDSKINFKVVGTILGSRTG
ncbi:MAG: hypothetical protein OEW90_05025 [Betaproteobacteria bacterium]|nr:hypothetical protein [Betaproteobacteria bacterium]MDH4323482.1 hypothetical protein [Betaproteobacteria bacterium]